MGVRINAPSRLISRVRPSPCRRLFWKFSQVNIAGASSRYRISFLMSMRAVRFAPETPSPEPRVQSAFRVRRTIKGLWLFGQEVTRTRRAVQGGSPLSRPAALPCARDIYMQSQGD